MWVIIKDKKTALKLNDLARHQLIKKILADINIDLNICKLEWWSCEEYIDMIKKEIDIIYFKFKRCNETNTNT